MLDAQPVGEAITSPPPRLRPSAPPATAPRTAAARASSSSNCAKSSDCAPSLIALSGVGCTSTINPSAPIATPPAAGFHAAGPLPGCPDGHWPKSLFRPGRHRCYTNTCASLYLRWPAALANRPQLLLRRTLRPRRFRRRTRHLDGLEH